jgi:hypothetical protein
VRYVVRCKIEDHIIELAKEHMLGKTLNRSITNGERDLMSTIAEIYFIHMMDILKFENIDYVRSMDYDVLIDNLKIDIKAKQRTVDPKPDYMASIVAYSKTKQKCDYYAFCQITVDRSGTFKDFYYIGGISKELYFKKSEFKRKGELDGSNMVNGSRFRIREDCYNLAYENLKSLSKEDSEILSDKKFEIIEW